MNAWQTNTISDLIRRSANRYRDKKALLFEDRVWTYEELDKAATILARAFLDHGLEPGDRLATFGRNSDAYLLAFLGAARAKLIHVPVNYNLKGQELHYILAQSGASCVLCDEDLMPLVEEALSRGDGSLSDRTYLQGHELTHRVKWSSTLRRVELNGDGLDVLSIGLAAKKDPSETGAAEIDLPQVEDEDLVQLLYTSGTTAAPKGAMMTNRALMAEYLSCIIALDLDTNDRPLHCLPLYHSAQMHAFLMPYLMIGATNVLMEHPEPTAILAQLEAHRITSFFAPPTLWISLLNHPDLRTRDLVSLERAYYGASIMPVPVLKALWEALPGIGFYNAFGQSEIAPLATVLRPEEHEARPDSAGRAVPLVEVAVVDENMNPVQPGEMGEVVYRSPQLCSGYWDKPEETQEAFKGGWFHSGDLVRIDDEGYLFVVDRIKDVINTGGVLVASREVEETLYEHPAVAAVAVVGMPDPKWIEAITAFVVPKGPVTEEELKAFARERLAPFKVPKSVRFVEALPQNASGKILKRELRDSFADQSQ
jgi:fatty-acyl-CoA synthase